MRPGPFNVAEDEQMNKKVARTEKAKEEVNTIKVIICEPGKLARTEHIAASLEGMQHVVGGYIEQFMPFRDEAAIICNEEGKINGLPLNRSVFDEDSGELIDIIGGTFFIVYAPYESEHFLSLPDDLNEKYLEKYRYPEEFLLIDGKVSVLSFDPENSANHPAVYHGYVHEDLAEYGKEADGDRVNELKKHHPNSAGKTIRKQLDDIMKQLERGVQDIFESGKYEEYLACMSKFHNYSLNNTLLIAMQRPDASLVAGFNAWKNIHKRHVKKGEKGIRILAPFMYKVEVESDDEENEGLKTIQMVGFRPAYVFDVIQTEGEALPSLGINELNGDVQGFDRMLNALKDIAPYPVEFEKITTGAKGYFSDTEKRIVLNKGMSELQTIKTFVHETAHALLHSKAAMDEDVIIDRRTKEVEAESIAFAVCKKYDLNTDDYSFGYIAGWSSGKETSELRESLERIKDTADKMITQIDEYLENDNYLESTEEVTISSGKANEETEEYMAGITDLSDAPEDLKNQILESDELLRNRDRILRFSPNQTVNESLAEYAAAHKEEEFPGFRVVLVTGEYSESEYRAMNKDEVVNDYMNHNERKILKYFQTYNEAVEYIYKELKETTGAVIADKGFDLKVTHAVVEYLQYDDEGDIITIDTDYVSEKPVEYDPFDRNMDIYRDEDGDLHLDFSSEYSYSEFHGVISTRDSKYISRTIEFDQYLNNVLLGPYFKPYLNNGLSLSQVYDNIADNLVHHIRQNIETDLGGIWLTPKEEVRIESFLKKEISEPREGTKEEAVLEAFKEAFIERKLDLDFEDNIMSIRESHLRQTDTTRGAGDKDRNKICDKGEEL